MPVVDGVGSSTGTGAGSGVSISTAASVGLCVSVGSAQAVGYIQAGYAAGTSTAAAVSSTILTPLFPTSGKIQMLAKESRAGVFFKAAILTRKTLGGLPRHFVPNAISFAAGWVIDRATSIIYGHSPGHGNVLESINLETGEVKFGTVAISGYAWDRAVDRHHNVWAIRSTGVGITGPYGHVGTNVWLVEFDGETLERKREVFVSEALGDFEGGFTYADMSSCNVDEKVLIADMRGIGNNKLHAYRQRDLGYLWSFAGYDGGGNFLGKIWTSVIDHDGDVWVLADDHIGFPGPTYAHLIKLDGQTGDVINWWDVTSTIGTNGERGLAYDEVSNSLIMEGAPGPGFVRTYVRWSVALEAFNGSLTVEDTGSGSYSNHLKAGTYQGRFWISSGLGTQKGLIEIDVPTMRIVRVIDGTTLGAASVQGLGLGPIYAPKLNSLYGGYGAGSGTHTAELYLDPLSDDKDYFADFQRPFAFDGHIYRPLPMAVSGQASTSSMETPTVDLTVPNLGNEVIKYIQRNRLEIIRAPVAIQDLHMSEDGLVELYTEEDYIIIMITTDRARATFHLSVFGSTLDDPIPRETMEKREFVAMRDDVIRVG